MLNILAERYPDLAFRLQFVNEPEPIPEPETFSLPSSLSSLEVIYIYGIGTGLHYEKLQDWLHEDKRRALVFIEDDLDCLSRFLQASIAKQLLQDPQAHIHFGNTIDELVLSYPTKKIEFLCAKPAPPSFALNLYRKTSSITALFSEVLYYHKMMENLLPGIQKAPEAFLGHALIGKFSGIPAVICGAGPSLASSISILKKLENRALIFAGGSTLSALKRFGVTPHLGMALDPNPEEYDRLLPAAPIEIPLLYANRLLPSVFSLCKGPIGYLRTNTGGVFETWMEEKLGITAEEIGPDLGPEAFSVTTMQLAFATLLGCNPIILTGVDLAFTRGKRYAEGVVKDPSILLNTLRKETRVEDRLLRKKGRKGKFVHTLVKWVMESDTVSAYAKKHSSTTYINATEDGLGFKEIPFLPLEEAVEKYCQKTENLREKIALAIAEAPPPAKKEEIAHLLQELRSSLERCETLLEKIVKELETNPSLDNGKLLILQIDLEEEIAFDAFLQQIGPVLDKVTARFFEERSIEKYRQILSMVQDLRACFAKYVR